MLDPELPPPTDPELTPRQLLAELESHLGEAAAAELCAELLTSDDPHDHLNALVFLGGRAGESVLAGGSWKPYWARVWGARGLLYVWSDSVTGAVLTGLRDEHWRVAEMCLKVSAKREVPGADDAAHLATHELSRVRIAALRVLGSSGEVEHAQQVTEALADQDEAVRRAAARALDRLATRLDLSVTR